MNSKKKELKLQYKLLKPEMGIYIVRSKAKNKCFIDTTQNLKAKINSTTAKLQGGMHPYLELQKEWNNRGEENFTIEILEVLEYDKDESKTDYKEELAVLQMKWEEKLLKEDFEFYKKK